MKSYSLNLRQAIAIGKRFGRRIILLFFLGSVLTLSTGCNQAEKAPEKLDTVLAGEELEEEVEEVKDIPPPIR